jgi:hypothetical protein
VRCKWRKDQFRKTAINIEECQMIIGAGLNEAVTNACLFSK